MSDEWYKPMEEHKTLTKVWPAELMPTPEEKETVNDFFRAYIFFRENKAGREIMTSCCGKHIEPLARTRPALYDAEWKPRNTRIMCPFCGRPAVMKEIRYLRTKKNLLEYQPVVFLKERDSALWALAAWTRKDYQNDLIEPPLYHIVGVYLFRPGRAEKWTPSYRGIEHDVIEGNYNPGKRPFGEPFTDGGGCFITHPAYRVIGLDAIERSAFRYCQYDMYRCRWDGEMHSSLMRYLSVCSIYPRDVEMLTKCNASGLVSDIVVGRKKNAAIYKWGAGDPRKAFGLDGQELRAWRESGLGVYRIGDYKTLKKRGLKTSFDELALCARAFGHGYGDMIATCLERQVRPIKMYRYFERQESYRDAGAAYRDWEGYIKLAKRLEWSLDEETVRYPRDLRRKHDEATDEYNLKVARERAEEVRARRRADAKLAREAKERLKKWRDKYNFAADGYVIRVAETPAEIREEGQTLRHCVGGYAERHMAGKTTILFLRREDEPDVSLVTIEMSGDRLVQIHGYRNEYDGAPSPEVTYKELLDAWLDWLSRGSPRDKAGRPRMKKKGTKAA